MGLLTKEVEVTLNNKWIKYYEEKGYEIPRYKDNLGKERVKAGTKIKASIKDVPLYSAINVEVKCDCCGKVTNTSYQNYNKHNHDGLTYCTECSSTVLISGENSPCWKHDITIEERENRRGYLEYTNFIKRVLLRDDFTCLCCGRRENEMEVHHLDGYNWCVEKRTDDSNAVTLCKNCHANFHSIYGMGDNTKEQFEEWIGYTLPLLDEYQGVLPTTRKIYCLEDNCVYDSAKQVSRINNHNLPQIYKCCNKEGYKDGKTHSTKSVGGKHYFWMDEFEKMTQRELDDYMEWANSMNYNHSFGKYRYNSKAVVCVTTNKLFDTLTEAVNYYNLGGTSNLSKCCRGIYKSYGKLSDGTKLRWIYYEDYIKEFDKSTLTPYRVGA